MIYKYLLLYDIHVFGTIIEKKVGAKLQKLALFWYFGTYNLDFDGSNVNSKWDKLKTKRNTTFTILLNYQAYTLNGKNFGGNKQQLIYIDW